MIALKVSGGHTRVSAGKQTACSFTNLNTSLDLHEGHKQNNKRQEKSKCMTGGGSTYIT